MPSLSRPIAAASVVIAAVLAVVLATVLLQSGHGPLLATAASADTSNASTAPSVTVSGIGTVKGVPDTMTATFGVSVTRSSVQGALDAVATDAAKVVSALKSQGVPDKDIATDNLSLNPSYDNRGNPNGYGANESVVATITPLTHAGSILSGAATAAGNAGQIQGFSLSIGDNSSLLTQARNAAFADAQAKAQQYAGLSHSSLGQVLTVSETVTQASQPQQYDAAAGAASPMALKAVPVEAGQQDEQVTVTVKWALG